MANSSAFGESVDLLGSIRSILDNYPFSGGLLREILQNSDDAGATNQVFLLDCRKHPTERICSEKIAESQGPALLAFNNATFLPEDWKALQNISRSSKREDTSKIGKFGIGIRSCYHITDHLQVLSGEEFVIFDPLFSFSNDGGTRFRLSPETIDPIYHHFCAFDQFLPDGWDGEAFNGTVVRLPLRTEPSDLREKVVQPTEIEGLFCNFIQDEMNISMLFLQHLRSIEFVVVREDGRVHQLGKCTIEATDLLPNGTCTKVVHVETPQARPKVEKWLVLDHHFPQEDALRQLSSLAGSLSERVLKKHKLRPDVGLAFPLDPIPPPDSGIGQLFTFLRLPLATGFPAHVHGFFSLTPSRQNLRNPVDSGVVKGSDDDILVKWNNILFEVFIPRAWTSLLITLAELNAPIDISLAWPATQSFTKCGESIYWTSFPENVLKHVIETGAAVWPTLEQNSYKDLHNVFFVCSRIQNGAPEALARQGLSICRPPAHIFKMLSDSDWRHQCLLTPENASATLQRHWQGTSSPIVSDQDRNAIIQYLLSSGNIKNIVNLPIIPTVSGRLVALRERNSPAAVVHTLLTRPDFELFHTCDGDAIFLGHLPPSVVQVFERSGPTGVNVKLLDNSQVLKYLDCHPTRQGVDLATFRVDGEASQFLSRFWIWLEGWRRRSELVPMLESRYLLPESHGMRRAIRTQPLFKAVETQPKLATSLTKLGIPFISTSLQLEAQEKLEIFGFLKTVGDIRDILKCLARCHIAGAVPLTDEEAAVVLKHFNRCMVDVPIKDFSGPEREAFKRVPIFPVVQFKDNEQGFEKRFASVDGLTVYGVCSFELLPQLDNTVFIDTKSHPSALDPALLPILSKRHLQSDLDLLELCATALPQHPKEHLVRILKHAASRRQSIPPKLRDILRSKPYAYAANGFREVPQALIDQNSPIRFLYVREQSRLPRLEDNYDHQIVEALSELGLLDQSLSASNVMDRIRSIAITHDVENCLLFLQVLEEHSFNYKSLSGHGFNKSIAWLPTQKRSLANAIDCRPTWLPNAKPELFDQVLDLLDDTARIPASLQRILGWHECVPLEVLFEQFERALELPQIAAFSRVKCLLIEVSQRDLTRRHSKQLHDILRSKAWVPTTAGKLVEEWRAVFVSAFPGVFTIDSELKNSQDGKWLLKQLGCLEEPSFDTIQRRLTQLSKEAPSPSRTHSAIDALKFACSRLVNLKPEERSQLVVPDKSHEFVPVDDVVFDDLGPEKSVFVSQGLCIASSAVDNSLAVYLGLERLGLKHSHLHTLGEDMGVKTVTIVQKTLEQYTEKQFLPEFLANAQDAGASTFAIIVNEFTSTEGNFLYPTFRDGLHRGPSVMIYNDSEFSKQDFDGICQIYLGGKTNNPDSIGQFGLGALTMFHITECAVIYSGNEVLFLDPSKKYLPIVKQAAIRLPLKVIHNDYPGHTRLLRGLECFDPVAPRVNGTIFFLPLRTPGTCPSPFIPNMYSLDLFRRHILQDFKAKAAECLLFIKLNHIKAISRESFQTSRQLWSFTAQRSHSEEDEENGTVETEMAIESLSAGESRGSTTNWLIMSKAFQSSDVPPGCRLELGSKTLRVGLAACLTDEQKIQSKFFSMLPLALPTSLPVHVNASFRMSSDRRQIRLDAYDNDDTRFNRWLLTSQLPSVYLALLEGIARKRDNSRWWPGVRVRAAQTQDEEEAEQMTTVHEDSLTATLTKAFYSGHLPSSACRVFCSMYNDQAFDFPTAILFSRLAPDAVQEVCNILRPPALIKLSTEVMSRMRTEKVELKILGAKFVKELLLTGGGAEIIRETLVHEALEELLVFVSEGDGNNLLGLPLLCLQDKTWTRFQSDGTSMRYHSHSTHEYVKNSLFPADRFVHSQFFPSQETQAGSLLLKILLKSNVNVENLDSGAVKQLTEERLASMLPGDKNAWIMSFWRTYPFFPPEGLNKSMESLPLVPTWNGTAYKSFLEFKNNSALVIDRHVDHPEWLQSCLDDLGIHVVELDTRFPSTLHLLLESSEYAATGSFFHRFLACLCPIVDDAVERIRSWPTQRQSTFADWVRSQVNSHPAIEKGNILQVARKLPVWRARKGTEETLCPAHQVQLLPYRIPLEVGCFSTTFRTSDGGVHYLGVQRTTIEELHRRLTIPNVLDEGEKEDVYKVLVRSYIDSDYIEHIIMPNAGRRMVDCEDIFERSPFFQAVFGESSPRFLLRSFDIFERDMHSMGLRREGNLNLPLFRQCAQAFHDDPTPAHEKLERAQIVYRFYCETLPLQVPSGHSAQWHDLDRIRFIPRNPNQVRRRGRTSEIELPLHIRQLPSLVSPGEVVQERFLEIAWTQRVALQTEPAQRLLVAFPDFGCPTGPEVIAHLKVLCQLPRGTIVLHDLKATYQWLTENSPAVASSVHGLKDEPIFLNVDNPDVDEWRWSSASQMAFETEDLTSIQGVRQFLLPFRAFLKSVGVLEAYYPEIEADSEDSGALYDQKQFQSLREKLNAQRLAGKFTDVLFVPRKEAKGRTREELYELDHPSLRGHRSYLAGCVPWFEDMFLGEFREGYGGSAGGVVGSAGDGDGDSDIDDEDTPEGERSAEGGGSGSTEYLANMLIVPLPKSRQAIKAVLNYLYTGQPFPEEGDVLRDLLQTLKLAHFLDIRGLFDLCQREMIRRRLVNPETVAEVRESIQDLDANVIKKWCEDYENANPELIRLFSQER